MVRNHIFVTGFESSGTTMLRRIISMHPCLQKDLIHEGKKLFSYSDRNDADMRYGDKYTSVVSGEKIPYFCNHEYVVQYIRRWKQYWPNAPIFHIIRNQAKIAASSARRFGRSYDYTMDTYKKNENYMRAFLQDISDVQHVFYELFVVEPIRTVKSIYDYIGGDVSYQYIRKVISTRDPWYYGKKRCCGLRYKETVK